MQRPSELPRGASHGLLQTAYVVFVQATSDRDWLLDSRRDWLLQRQVELSRLYLEEAIQHLLMRTRITPRFGLG
jgi:hypothetical protein